MKVEKKFRILLHFGYLLEFVVKIWRFFFSNFEIYLKLQKCESLSPKKKTLGLKIGICYTSYIFFGAFSSTFKSVIYFSKKQYWNFIKYIINSLLGIL